MNQFYSPENLSHILPYLQPPWFAKVVTPKWLLLGGPASGCEAQEARRQWPGIGIVAVEPNEEAVYWQMKHGWPKGAVLIHGALHDLDGPVRVSSPAGFLQSTRVDPHGTEVLGYTWDKLDELYGPFEDALLWMDIETHELEAVRGAEGILGRRAVLLVNVEMQSRLPEKNAELDAILRRHDFRIVHEWNDSPQCWDRVYLRRWQ